MRRLTPTSEWKCNDKFAWNWSEDYHQFFEHDNSLCPHPEEGGEDEVEDDNWRECAEDLCLCTLNPNQKWQAKSQEGKEKLDVEFCHISATQTSMECGMENIFAHRVPHPTSTHTKINNVFNLVQYLIVFHAYHCWSDWLSPYFAPSRVIRLKMIPKIDSVTPM